MKTRKNKMELQDRFLERTNDGLNFPHPLSAEKLYEGEKRVFLKDAASLLANPNGYQFTKVLDFISKSDTTVQNLQFGGLFNDREWRAISKGEASIEVDLNMTDGAGLQIRAHGSLTPKELAQFSVTTSDNSFITALIGNISGSMGYKGCAVNLMFTHDSSYRYCLTINSIYYDTNKVSLTAGITGTFTITVKPCSYLAGMTWAEVEEAVNNGYVPEGATKVALVDGVPYLFRMVDASGANIPLTAGGYAKSIWMAEECLVNHLAWDSSGSSANGYGSSEIRTTLLNTIFPTVETELQSVIKKVTLKSGKGGSTTDLASSTDNTLFLPAIEELYGAATAYSMAGEGTQFNYFKSLGVSQRNYKSLMRAKKGTSECADEFGNHRGMWYYWLRSPLTGNANAAYYVSNNGNCYNDVCADTHASLVPCFCI